MPVVFTASDATKEESSLPAAGLTCSLHLRSHVWQEINNKKFFRCMDYAGVIATVGDTTVGGLALT